MRPVRTRFAPSPTGYMHLGGARTALFAWLLARRSEGQFILRIEDTDQARKITGSTQHIIDSLHWLGLNWDEGPDIGGTHGPYKQSDRLAIYKEWADRLVAAGRAYADPYTPEEVNEFREKAKVEKKPFLFRNYRPTNPPQWDGHSALRFKSHPQSYFWHDAVMGDMSSPESAIDDFLILKSDGYPTYNFAHIIDDHLMDITCVLRSQEFIASVPRFLNLYDALMFERPILATLPFVLGPTGTKKLSKRDGAKDILDYAKEGYLPDAMFNFLATLGWNDGTDQEIFSRTEILTKFNIAHVHKNGANIDEQRLNWMNSQYIRKLTIDELLEKAKDYWPTVAAKADDGYKAKVLGLIQDRLKYLSEIPELTSFFFTDLPVDMPLITKNGQLQKVGIPSLHPLLETAAAELKESAFTVEDLTERLNGLLVKTNQKPAVLFSLIRIVTTWAPASPGLAETLSVLGKDKSLKRIEKALEII